MECINMADIATKENNKLSLSYTNQKLYHLVEEQVADLQQTLHFMQKKHSINQIKQSISRSYSIFCQTQPIYQEISASELYQQNKKLMNCFGVIFLILVDYAQKSPAYIEAEIFKTHTDNKKMQKQQQLIANKAPDQNERKKTEEKVSTIVEKIEVGKSKPKRMGGIYIYNQQYRRNVQIMADLCERRKKKDVLQKEKADAKAKFTQSVLQDINEVDARYVDADQITIFLNQRKHMKEEQIFHDNTFHNELEQIAIFFKESQNQALQFLNKSKDHSTMIEFTQNFNRIIKQYENKKNSYMAEVTKKIHDFMMMVKAKHDQIVQDYNQKLQQLERWKQKPFVRTVNNETQTTRDFIEEINILNKQLKEAKESYSTLQQFQAKKMNQDLNQINQLRSQLNFKENQICKQQSMIKSKQLLISALENKIKIMTQFKKRSRQQSFLHLDKEVKERIIHQFLSTDKKQKQQTEKQKPISLSAKLQEQKLSKNDLHFHSSLMNPDKQGSYWVFQIRKQSNQLQENRDSIRQSSDFEDEAHTPYLKRKKSRQSFIPTLQHSKRSSQQYEKSKLKFKNNSLMLEKSNDLFHAFQNKIQNSQYKESDNVSVASESHLSTTSNNMKKTFGQSSMSLTAKAQAQTSWLGPQIIQQQPQQISGRQSERQITPAGSKLKLNPSQKSFKTLYGQKIASKSTIRYAQESKISKRQIQTINKKKQPQILKPKIVKKTMLEKDHRTSVNSNIVDKRIKNVQKNKNVKSRNTQIVKSINDLKLSSEIQAGNWPNSSISPPPQTQNIMEIKEQKQRSSHQPQSLSYLAYETDIQTSEHKISTIIQQKKQNSKKQNIKQLEFIPTIFNIAYYNKNNIVESQKHKNIDLNIFREINVQIQAKHVERQMYPSSNYKQQNYDALTDNRISILQNVVRQVNSEKQKRVLNEIKSYNHNTSQAIDLHHKTKQRWHKEKQQRSFRDDVATSCIHRPKDDRVNQLQKQSQRSIDQVKNNSIKLIQQTQQYLQKDQPSSLRNNQLSWNVKRMESLGNQSSKSSQKLCKINQIELIKKLKMQKSIDSLNNNSLQRTSKLKSQEQNNLYDFRNNSVNRESFKISSLQEPTSIQLELIAIKLARTSKNKNQYIQKLKKVHMQHCGEGCQHLKRYSDNFMKYRQKDSKRQLFKLHVEDIHDNIPVLQQNTRNQQLPAINREHRKK